MTQAFFALSGGFAIPSSDFHPSPHLTLTPPALLFLTYHGHLPSAPTPTISDKSKADAVAKVFVCLQAGWFLVQCVARLAQKLPLTLLEVHVLTHVLCAFVMYVLWHEKPYDVGAPILVEDGWVRDVVAFWALHVDLDSPSMCGDQRLCPCAQEPLPLTIKQVQSAHQHFHTSFWRTYGCGILRKGGERFTEKAKPLPAQLHENPTEVQLAHLHEANNALLSFRQRGIHFPYVSQATQYLKPSSDPLDPKYHFEPHTSVGLPHRYIVPVCSNLIIEGFKALDTDDTNLEIFNNEAHLLNQLKTYAVMSVVYGGLHLTAWNSHFASTAELWMWRVSGLVVASASLVSLVGFVAWDGSTKLYNLRRKTKSVLARGMYRLGKAVLRTGCLAVGVLALYLWVAYPVARVYVLAEAFAALRESERDVYRTVEWAGFIPHVG